MRNRIFGGLLCITLACYVIGATEFKQTLPGEQVAIARIELALTIGIAALVWLSITAYAAVLTLFGRRLTRLVPLTLALLLLMTQATTLFFPPELRNYVLDLYPGPWWLESIVAPLVVSVLLLLVVFFGKGNEPKP